MIQCRWVGGVNSMNEQLKSEVARAASSGWFLPSIDPVDFSVLVRAEKLRQSQQIEAARKEQERRVEGVSTWCNIAGANINNWKSADSILTLLCETYRDHTYLSVFLRFGNIVQYAYKLDRIPQYYFRGKWAAENDLDLPNMRHICQVSNGGSVATRQVRERAEDVCVKLRESINASTEHLGLPIQDIGYVTQPFCAAWDDAYTRWFSGDYEYDAPRPTVQHLLTARAIASREAVVIEKRRARLQQIRNRKNIKINPMEILASVSKLTNICK